MAEYYTITDQRPDLAAIEVNPPEGYIGTKLMPVVPVMDKTGTIYYSTVTADETAQTARSEGIAPTGTQISDSSTTFTAAEAIDRGKITPDEAKQMGGIEKADQVGIRFSKRNVMNYLESDICALILQSGSESDATFDEQNAATQVQDALQAVRLYEGRTVLAASTWTLKAMIQQMLQSATYAAAFSRLISGTSSLEAARGLSFEAWKQAIALFFGVDEVLGGDDTIWNATAVQGRFAVAKISSDSDPISHKYKPELGKTFMFYPDGTQPFYCESIGDRITKNNYYDTTIWYDAIMLNAASVYVFDGVSG